MNEIVNQTVPLITFGIPAFKNVCLEDAIRSILGQTYPNIELVIVNDASPEDLAATVGKFNDPRICYYENKENLGKNGPVKNWNKVLEYARGEYFVLASDDDVFMPEFASDLMQCFKDHPQIETAHCRLKTIDSAGRVEYSASCPEWETGIDFVWHALRDARLLSISEFLCRTKSLKDAGGFVDFPLAWSSDYATWFLLAASGGVGYVGLPLLEKRNLGNNLTSKFPLEKAIQSSFEYSKWLRTFLQTLHPSNDLDKELLSDIFRVAGKKYDKLIVATASSYWRYRANVLSPFEWIIKWAGWRKRYEITLSVFLMSEMDIFRFVIVRAVRRWFG